MIRWSTIALAHSHRQEQFGPWEGILRPEEAWVCDCPACSAVRSSLTDSDKSPEWGTISETKKIRENPRRES